MWYLMSVDYQEDTSSFNNNLRQSFMHLMENPLDWKSP